MSLINIEKQKKKLKYETPIFLFFAFTDSIIT